MPHVTRANDGDGVLSTQFLSRDPAVATTRAPYGYVAGNPVNLVDPTGLADYSATAYVAVKDVLQVPLTSEWLTVRWSTSGSTVTIVSAYIVTQTHDGGFIFGQWTVDPNNERLARSGRAVTGKVGFNSNGGLIDLTGSYYNTLQLSITVCANGAWTYSVNHWIRNDFHFGYSWGAWNGSPNEAPFWDGPS